MKNNDAIPVLDKGFVRLVEFMGGDQGVVDAARVSYGRGTRRVSEDRAEVEPREACEKAFRHSEHHRVRPHEHIILRDP